MRKITRVIGAVAVASLALSACGAGNGSADGKSDKKLDLAALNPHPRDEVQQGGTLRLAISALPENWNYSNTQGGTTELARIYDWVAPTNFVVSSDGKVVIRKEFLDSFKEEGGKDGQPFKVTLNLNKKAIWNDGKPITFEDYVSAWKACNGKTPAYNCASTDGWDKIASITKGTDEYQVVVTFTDTYPDWKGLLSVQYSAEGAATPDVFNKSWISNPHSEWLSGPYKIGEVDSTSATPKIHLVPNPKWWGNKPKLDEIIYTVYSDNRARNTSYINKELDAVSDIITADAYKLVQARQDGAVRVTPGTQWRAYTINSTSGPFKEVAVRQAFMYAINRSDLMKALLAGLPMPPKVETLGNHFRLPGQEYYVNNGPKYDVEKAKKLLEDAGWKLPAGKKVREKDGQPLVVKLGDFADVASTAKENQIVQKMLTEAGFDAQLDTLDSSKFSEILTNGQFQALSFTWQGTIYPYGGAKQIYGCAEKDDQGNVSWGSNYSRLCDPATTPLINDLATEDDEAKRVEIGDKLDKILWKDVFNVPLYQRNFIWAMRKDIANYGPALFESTTPEDVGYVKQK